MTARAQGLGNRARAFAAEQAAAGPAAGKVLRGARPSVDDTGPFEDGEAFASAVPART
ncbi:hypothetical protein [Streptomyces glaucus]|uniref:Secreted protein n=1 Tax=Streptomyces glaucus TaxID=284029 RepID=A0ABN3KGF2_9ACTN